MKKILIVGATSAIAKATARLWAGQGHRLYLLARNQEHLATLAADLRIRGAATVEYAVLDITEFASHEAAIFRAGQALDGIDIALIAHGSLGNQRSCERDVELALKELDINAISVISLLTCLANEFEHQKHGTIAVISSVAGDRGRQSNYVYGAAKGMVTIFMQGLRQRLCKSGVHVLTIKPGFVDTPMTGDFKKGILWANPDRIANDIAAAVEKKRNVIYTPFFWWGVVTTVKLIPEFIFKRLKT